MIGRQAGDQSQLFYLFNGEGARREAARRRLFCEILDLRFQAVPDEITPCHSSLGGEFGEGIDVVKDAQQRLRRRERSSRP
jgi:hypothetical protein